MKRAMVKYHRFLIGDRTKQGLIVGMEKYPPDGYLAREYGNEWGYTVLPDKDSEYTRYFCESEIEPLSCEELKAEIETEIKQHELELTALHAKLASI